MQLDTTIVNSFIQRLCRIELSAETTEFIKGEVLERLRDLHGENYQWVLLSIVVALKNTEFGVILLHQDEYPDVREFVRIIRDELIFNELKIT